MLGVSETGVVGGGASSRRRSPSVTGSLWSKGGVGPFLAEAPTAGVATVDLLEAFGVFTNNRSSLCSLAVFKVVLGEESVVGVGSETLSWISKFEHSNIMSLSSGASGESLALLDSA